jgi:hypothetical protein
LRQPWLPFALRQTDPAGRGAVHRHYATGVHIVALPAVKIFKPWRRLTQLLAVVLPAIGIQKLLEQGELVEVLHHFPARPMPIHLLYPGIGLAGKWCSTSTSSPCSSSF